jgi:hypothetical protein
MTITRTDDRVRFSVRLHPGRQEIDRVCDHNFVAYRRLSRIIDSSLYTLDFYPVRWRKYRGHNYRRAFNYRDTYNGIVKNRNRV